MIVEVLDILHDPTILFSAISRIQVQNLSFIVLLFVADNVEATGESWCPGKGSKCV